MFKKLLSVAALGALLSSSAFADDILAKVSNGAISDNSAGVKVLSLDEMKQVKGGYGLLNDGEVFIFQNLNLGGGASLTQIGVIPMLTKYEKDNKVSCGFNGDGCLPDLYTNQQNYKEFVSQANPDLNEFLAVTSTKTTTIGIFGIPQYKFTSGGMVIGINGNGSVYKIRNADASNKIVREVLRNVENNLNKILVNQFR